MVCCHLGAFDRIVGSHFDENAHKSYVDALAIVSTLYMLGQRDFAVGSPIEINNFLILSIVSDGIECGLEIVLMFGLSFIGFD